MTFVNYKNHIFTLGGNPKFDDEHPLRLLYNDGVRFGSWGMSIYSISCSIYSFNIQSLNNYFGRFLIL
jgi:solute carrier family 45 protein 1/2/4